MVRTSLFMFPKYSAEYQNVKVDSEIKIIKIDKSKKKKHKSNVLKKEKEKRHENRNYLNKFFTYLFTSFTHRYL